MGHHDQTSPTQGHPRDAVAQQGSGDLVGAQDQSGSGLTSEPRLDDSPAPATAESVSDESKKSTTAWTADQQDGPEAAEDARRSLPTPR